MGAKDTQTGLESDKKDAAAGDRDADKKAEPKGLPTPDRQQTETVHDA